MNIVKNSKEKLANEPNNKRKAKTTDNGKKRSRDTKEIEANGDVMVKSLAVKSKRIQNGKEKSCAKRRIIFDEIEESNEVNHSIQSNNNATVARISQRKINNHKQPVLNSKVQWTKEFMDKVKRSNAKYRVRKAKKNEKIQPTNEEMNKELCYSLQVDRPRQQKGDGIETTINTEELEELDYEDDLSVDEEIFPVPEDDFADENRCESPQPGMSGVQQMSKQPEGEDQILTDTSEERLMNNPVIQRMMEKFFDKHFRDMQESGMNSGGNQNKGEQVKSPSDTTIYAPALQKKLTPNRETNANMLGRVGMTPDTLNLSHQLDRMNMNIHVEDPVEAVVNHRFDYGDNTDNRVIGNTNNMVIGNNPMSNPINPSDTIHDFVEMVRVENHPDDAVVMKKRKEIPELEQARIKTGKTIIEAEKFWAAIEPPGTDLNHLPNIGSGVSDDDFFHLTCHIEPSLIHKIEKGEFVELEKLVPKEKLENKNPEESRLEWVQRDGGMFLVPTQKDNKINSFRHWEQAFRAYAIIYCGANPHRAKEIWQYITVINTAASSYVWDNVYNYDNTFRHLMALNPHRSWVVTYNQMWNLSMKDPIPKSSSNSKGFVSHQSSNGNRNNNYSNNNVQGRRNKSDYCWNFNKGVPCRFGAKCKFIERCKNCESPTHGVHACHKLQKKDVSRATSNNGQDHVAK